MYTKYGNPVGSETSKKVENLPKNPASKFQFFLFISYFHSNFEKKTVPDFLLIYIFPFSKNISFFKRTA